MTEAPPISVVMPAYNAERYVATAIESILRQSHSDFEFLIFDDGSTDRTWQIASRFAADPRVRLVSREHRGLVPLLNEGVCMARGQFVARMDADDIADRHRLLHQMQYLREHPEVVAVGGQALLIDPEGRPIQPYVVPLSHQEIDTQHLGGRGGRIPHPSAMMRRDSLIAIGMYRGELWPAEDLDLFLRLAEVGKLANLPEVVLRYRVHLRSVSATRSPEQQEAAYRAVAAACTRRGMAVPERPTLSAAPDTAEQQQRQWIGAAIMAGNHPTARTWAFRLWREQPGDVSRWRLVASTLPVVGAAGRLLLAVFRRLRKTEGARPRETAGG